LNWYPKAAGARFPAHHAQKVIHFISLAFHLGPTPARWRRLFPRQWVAFVAVNFQHVGAVRLKPRFGLTSAITLMTQVENSRLARRSIALGDRLTCSASSVVSGATDTWLKYAGPYNLSVFP
jgi:hypothetical protein